MTEPTTMDALVERALDALAGVARAEGITEDEARRRYEERAQRRDREQSLSWSGIELPPDDIQAIVRDELARTESVDIVRRWLGKTILDRPILVISGAVGTGKTVAAGLALALTGGGVFAHAPELGRRLRPYSHELAGGLRRLDPRTGFLVVDDLGIEDATEARWSDAWSHLVDCRCARGRTLITSNLSKAALRERYGPRVSDRLRANCYWVELKKSESLRKGEAL